MLDDGQLFSDLVMEDSSYVAADQSTTAATDPVLMLKNRPKRSSLKQACLKSKSNNGSALHSPSDEEAEGLNPEQMTRLR